jgi:hypothetical protein
MPLFDHCANWPVLKLLFFLSLKMPAAVCWTRTPNLRMMGRVFCHCATASCKFTITFLLSLSPSLGASGRIRTLYLTIKGWASYHWVTAFGHCSLLVIFSLLVPELVFEPFIFRLWVDHSTTVPMSLAHFAATFCHFLSLGCRGRIWTLNLRIMSRAFHHYAIASDKLCSCILLFISLPMPEVGFEPSIL